MGSKLSTGFGKSTASILVEVLGDNAARVAEEFVDRVAFRMRSLQYGFVHAQGVYGDGPDAAVQQELRRAAVEERVIVVPGRPVVFVPSGPHHRDDACVE